MRPPSLLAVARSRVPIGLLAVLVLLGALVLPATSSGASGSATSPSGATVAVSKTSGVAPGETLVVTGSGFTTTGNLGTRPPLRNQPGGVYVAFGKFADTWRPSEGAPSSARVVINQKWAVPGEPAVLVNNPEYVPLNADGTFRLELTAGQRPDLEGNYGVFVFPGSGAVNADEELQVLVSFAQNPPPTTAPPATTVPVTPPTTAPPATTVPPTPPTTNAGRAVLGGFLDWGVKSSFRNYITGGIARGAITTGGGASEVGGVFRFPVTLGSVSDDGRRVTASFRGEVRFSGHGGLLDLLLRDLRVEFEGTSGRLVADVVSVPLNPSALGFGLAASAAITFDDVVLAQLTVPSGASASGATLTWSALGAVLTEAGVPAFSGFYTAGAELDMLTVVLQLEAQQTAPAGPGPVPAVPGAPTGSAPVASGPGTPTGPVPVAAVPGAPTNSAAVSASPTARPQSSQPRFTG